MSRTEALAPDTWVLVADGEKALFLRNQGDEEAPFFSVVKKEEIDNPPTREQAANHPGRFNDGPSAHRSAVDDTVWHQLEKERFADDLAAQLYKMAHKRRFNRLIIAAAPEVLGNLRPQLHKEVQACLVAEISKDFTNHPLDEVERLIVKSLH